MTIKRLTKNKRGNSAGQKRYENLNFIQITKTKTQMNKLFTPISAQRNKNLNYDLSFLPIKLAK